MPTLTIGDLAQNFLMRHSNARLSRNLSTLGDELTFGIKKDVAAAMSGDTGQVASIDRALVRLDAQMLATNEAGIRADATGIALKTFTSRLQSIDLSVLSQSATGPQLPALAAGAKQAFLGALSDLNGTAAGRPLFGGTAGAGPVLRNAEEIYANLVASVSAETTSQDASNAIDAYFADGGPFQTGDYLGEVTDDAPVRLGGGAVVEMNTRADDPKVRAGLAAMARVAMLGENIAMSLEEKAALGRNAVPHLLAATGGAIELHSQTGASQATIDSSKVRLGVERDALRTGRLDLLSADPYETATRLQQTEQQIETLHTLTARLSRLSLVNFI
ncbi:flagellin [Palleronia abyssalis]|uniref:Flagellin C-terminal domain-containing protein n=1 Tax=Palleronia abyssalis TaxID=1501240 RepID=A0A2R8BSH8_9RHOB|nr:flagellin [Palleronia abyssalis]SPJ23124.1 hypothetical protein PAA8504_00929 [Palleronia abyssalis]